MSWLILLRHGQSEWNKKNLFTGWIDIPLSQEGVQESLNAAKQLKNVPIDLIYTSTLIRGIMTAMLAMVGHVSNKVPVVLHPNEGKLEEWGVCYDPESAKDLIPVYCAWQLNERMYGELQGKNKETILKTYGEKQFKLWRRSFATPPPNGESLKMTAERTLPYFKETILPTLREHKNVLVAAHGNSLRSIVMNIEKLTEEEVVNLEIPTGIPIFYKFEKEHFTKQKEYFS